MSPHRDPDQLDPSNQSGRPVIVTAAIVGILVVLALMVVVYLLAS
jgi:cobalamin biosynthesis Mg chelatase CobN